MINTRLRRGLFYGVLLSVLLWLLITAVVVLAQAIDWQQDCISGTYDAVVNADGSVTVTCYLAIEPTATPEPTATEMPAATPEPTATATPGPAVNMLTNGNFHSGFTGWSMTNSRWQPHKAISCEPTGTKYAQMDIDNCTSCNTWAVGDEDWLWQDVTAPGPHSTVVLSLIEAHHMRSGTAEMRLYGSVDGVLWIEIFYRPGVEAPYGAGKCTMYGPPVAFTHEVAASYAYYRLEIYGRINELNDAWLIGGLELSIR